MFSITLIELAIAVILFVGGLSVTLFYIKGQIARTSADELERLAESRGQLIHDLEQKVDALTQAVTRLEAEVHAISKIKGREIGDYVIARLIEEGYRPVTSEGQL